MGAKRRGRQIRKSSFITKGEGGGSSDGAVTSLRHYSSLTGERLLEQFLLFYPLYLLSTLPCYLVFSPCTAWFPYIRYLSALFAIPGSPKQLCPAPQTSSSRLPRLHSCTAESLTFCGSCSHPSWSLCSWSPWHSWGLCDVTAKSNRLLAGSDRSSKGNSAPKLNIGIASPSALAPYTASVER